MFSQIFQPSPPSSPTRSRSNSYAPSPKLDSSPFSPRHPSHPRSLSLTSLSFTTLPSSARARAKLIRSVLVVLGFFLGAWVLLQKGQEVWGKSSLEELSRWNASVEGGGGRVLFERRGEPGTEEAELQGHGYPMSRALERTAELQDLKMRETLGVAPLPAPTNGGRPLRRSHHHQLQTTFVASNSNSRSPSPPSTGPPLTPPQELASLLHFLVSTPNGLLPPLTSYSPSTTPLSPEWVLDFDIGPEGEERDARMKQFEQEVWEGEGKLVVVGRENHVWMREVYKLLRKEYRVEVGEISVVDLDRRSDSLTIIPLLNRLLATDSNLHIILGGTSIGGFAELKALHEDGKLSSMLKSANVVIEAPKVVKKRRAAKKVVA